MTGTNWFIAGIYVGVGLVISIKNNSIFSAYIAAFGGQIAVVYIWISVGY